MNDILQIKHANSKEKLELLRAKMSNLSELKSLEKLSVYVTGSYARGEASVHSDIDLFFVLDGELEEIRDHKTKSLRAFSKIIDVADELGFPAFSNDGEYLKIIEMPKMKAELGGRDDDHLNYFTARMLMILESQPVYDEDTYYETVKDVLERISVTIHTTQKTSDQSS